MTKDNNECCLVIWGSSSVIAGLWMMSVLVGFYTIEQYTEDNCNIVNVISPTSIPMSNNTRDWVDCNCGKRCSSKTPCEQIYVDIPDGVKNKLIFKHTISEKSDGSECTFRNKQCSNEWDTYSRMISSKNHIQKYKNMMQNNQTITCWINSDKNEAYLDNDIDMTQVVASTILFGVSAILFGILLYHYNKKPKIEIDKKNVNHNSESHEEKTHESNHNCICMYPFLKCTSKSKNIQKV